MEISKPIYGEDYLCYSGNDYLGIATFINDPYIGDSFVRIVVHKSRGMEELIIMPDSWTKCSQ
ncbi:MAG: hypothetical protein ABIS01_07830 [Ferruginibacter sp.]